MSDHPASISAAAAKLVAQGYDPNPIYVNATTGDVVGLSAPRASDHSSSGGDEYPDVSGEPEVLQVFTDVRPDAVRFRAFYTPDEFYAVDLGRADVERLYAQLGAWLENTP